MLLVLEWWKGHRWPLALLRETLRCAIKPLRCGFLQSGNSTDATLFSLWI